VTGRTFQRRIDAQGASSNQKEANPDIFTWHDCDRNSWSTIKDKEAYED